MYKKEVRPCLNKEDGEQWKQWLAVDLCSLHTHTSISKHFGSRIQMV